MTLKSNGRDMDGQYDSEYFSFGLRYMLYLCNTSIFFEEEGGIMYTQNDFRTIISVCKSHLKLGLNPVRLISGGSVTICKQKTTAISRKSYIYLIVRSLCLALVLSLFGKSIKSNNGEAPPITTHYLFVLRYLPNRFGKKKH